MEPSDDVWVAQTTQKKYEFVFLLLAVVAQCPLCNLFVHVTLSQGHCFIPTLPEGSYAWKVLGDGDFYRAQWACIAVLQQLV